jgi:hypothetical protein
MLTYKNRPAGPVDYYTKFSDLLTWVLHPESQVLGLAVQSMTWDAPPQRGRGLAEVFHELCFLGGALIDPRCPSQP